MAFTPVKNVRIWSLTDGAVAQLRFGKAAVKSPDDTIHEVKVVSKREEGALALVTLHEITADNTVSETVVSRYPGAPWRADTSYVSLVGVDETTFAIQKTPGPIATDAIEQAISLVNKESGDVFGSQELVELLSQIKDGKRINTETKALANKLASKLVEELSNLPDDAA